MSRLLKFACVALCLSLLTPALAVYSDLQVSASGWSGQTVTIEIHNPNSGSESARVRVTLLLDDSTTVTLTSSNFTLAGGATISVPLSASRTIVAIEDDPEPISTLQ